MTGRKDFFVLYDYGQGGLWAVLCAESAEQIRRRYPQLTVYDQPPAALSQELKAEIRRTDRHDIDDQPTGWLAELRADDVG